MKKCSTPSSRLGRTWLFFALSLVSFPLTACYYNTPTSHFRPHVQQAPQPYYVNRNAVRQVPPVYRRPVPTNYQPRTAYQQRVPNAIRPPHLNVRTPAQVRPVAPPRYASRSAYTSRRPAPNFYKAPTAVRPPVRPALQQQSVPTRWVMASHEFRPYAQQQPPANLRHSPHSHSHAPVPHPVRVQAPATTNPRLTPNLVEVSKLWGHRVRPNESLSQIAALYKQSVSDLRAFNGLTSNRIQPNQIIQIPPPRNTYRFVPRG